MAEEASMKILFVASMSVIARDPQESRKLFIDVLGLPLERHEGDEYYFSEKVGGCKHFGVWPLAQAAEACFGSRTWPAERPIPHLSVEFEVADEESVRSAAAELQANGHEVLHPVRKEPWGQTIARVQTIDGAIVGISHAPWLHDAAG
jgi:catechol 2,3-dioxygenase-like lactoylglutathione lyase family enzyme